MASKRVPRSSKPVKRAGKPDPKSKPEVAGLLFQLHVLLLGSQPGTWRRLVVPGEVDLGLLHRILQAAMGWNPAHGHEFVVGDIKYSDSAVDIEHAEARDETGVRLCDVAPRANDSFTYLYDAGSDFEHEILVEKVSGRGEKFPGYPVCLDGEAECPSEDCGENGAYVSGLNALNEFESDDGEESAEWATEAFDSDAFDLDEINRRLRRVK